VGIDTIAASLSEARDGIEEIVEPFLIQLGFVKRTPRGRLLTAHAFRHLGLAVPQRPEITQGVLPLGETDDAA
jgi:holliday junction DNA helicase RuvB